MLVNSKKTKQLYFKCLREITSVGWLCVICACTRVDLPPAPTINIYQSSELLSNSSDHGQGSLTVAIPENRPPYFDGVYSNGIERDIINESFQLVGYLPEFMETANRQDKYDSKRFNIECAATISREYQLNSETYFSDPVISYKYTAFALKKSGITIRDYRDLSGKTVEAFSFATLYLGSEFTNIIPKMLNYAEHSNRSSQIVLFLRGHVDVLIMDRAMFYFTYRHLINARATDYNVEVVAMSLEKIVDFEMACHNENTIKAFNKGLAMLRASQRYEEIFKHYLSDQQF